MQSLVITATKPFGQTEGHTGHLTHCASHPASASLYEEENMCAWFSVWKFDTCASRVPLKSFEVTHRASVSQHWGGVH